MVKITVLQLPTIFHDENNRGIKRAELFDVGTKKLDPLEEWLEEPAMDTIKPQNH
jgi:hypothetical protein